MQARPFRLSGERAHAAVKALLRIEATAWAKEWFIQPQEPQVEVDIGECARLDGGWRHAGAGDESWVALRLRDGLWRELAAELFGSSGLGGAQPSVLMSAVMDESLGDLLNRLLAAAGGSGAVSHPAAGLASLRTGYGSGALQAAVSLGALHIDLGIGGHVVTALAARDTPRSPRVQPLSPREVCIAGGRIAVEVRVGEAELTVGELSQLMIGDVIRLDALHSKPLSVRTRSGRVVGAAYLGLREDHKAVQMAVQISDRKEAKHA